ncbi:hypothetical protein ES705_49727 [subsurface metagenome]
MVDMAEAFLSDLGFRNIRARHTGRAVRIEVDPDQVSQILDTGMKDRIETYLKSIGYEEITIDPDGYRRGKLNDGIVTKKSLDAAGLRIAH